MRYTFEQLNERYEAFTSSVRCKCVFATEAVGGQPASEEGVRAYVQHYLKITDPQEYEQAVQRILHEEVQPILRDETAESVTPPEGEIPEGSKHGLRVVRKDERGPWLGDWMIKACAKQAASRIYLFSQVFGTKGSFAEAGRVRAIGVSLQDPKQPNMVFLRNPEGTGPAKTYFKEFSGRVRTPGGLLNIIYESECIAPGSTFEFEFRFMPVKGLTEDAITDMVAMMQICGLGSNRSLECGKFRVLELDINMAKQYQAKEDKPKEEKKAKRPPKANGAGEGLAL